MMFGGRGLTPIQTVVPGAPDQVTSVILYSDGTPTTLYATFAMPAANGQPITQFEGVLSPSGATSTQTRFTLANSPIDALSCRVDFSGITNTTQTCQIRARNSNGPGAYSAASNGVIPVAFGDTWVDSANCNYFVCGGSTIGKSSLWNDTYFNNQIVRYVSPGTATNSGTFVPAMNAPAYPTGVGMTNQLLAEVTPQNASGYGYLVNIKLQNPALGTNGVYNANPYSRFVFYMYPTLAGTYEVSKIETTFNMEGVISAVAGNTITFANQTLATNTFPVGSSGVFDRTSSQQAAYASNTATTVTTSSSLSPAIGDHVLCQVGDKIVGSDPGNPANWVISPNAGVLTLNTWNRVEVPLGSTGYNLLVVNNGLIYKWNIAAPGNASGSVTYYCKVGYAV